MNYVYADITLARRLELAEGRSNADFVEARARVFPDSGAQWIEVAGAYAMFDGVGSPLTQTFGLGIVNAVSSNELDRIETFFQEKGAAVFHEVSPLADVSVLRLLNARHYQPIEFTSVMSRSITGHVRIEAPRNPRISVRVIRDDEHNHWVRTAAVGWSESPGIADFMLSLAQITAQLQNSVSFIAEVDGEPIATGALNMHHGIALLAGASTVPTGRKQGAQLALLEERLRYAADRGCDIAMMGALPGSASQRNAERQGFRIAYTRIKWQLDRAEGGG